MECISTTHTKLIVVFPLQQWLRERAAMLRYTYIVSFTVTVVVVEAVVVRLSLKFKGIPIIFFSLPELGLFLTS